jgi:hypothetical protein
MSAFSLWEKGGASRDEGYLFFFAVCTKNV